MPCVAAAHSATIGPTRQASSGPVYRSCLHQARVRLGEGVHLGFERHAVVHVLLCRMHCVGLEVPLLGEHPVMESFGQLDATSGGARLRGGKASAGEMRKVARSSPSQASTKVSTLPQGPRAPEEEVERWFRKAKTPVCPSGDLWRPSASIHATHCTFSPSGGHYAIQNLG